MQLLALLPHSKNVLGSIPKSGCICAEFACSVSTWVLSGTLASSHNMKTYKLGIKLVTLNFP